MKLMFNDAYTHIAGATQNMCKTDVQFLRQASAEIFREASLTGITRKEASEKLLTQMMARPEQFKFIDAKGHVWNNRSYCEMLGRTVMLNAGRQAYLDKCADEGNDIVVVTLSGTCCRSVPYGRTCRCPSPEALLVFILPKKPRMPGCFI
ncbi:MAG: hypothetical protein V8T87_10070 [Victivallales bacterium]